MHSLEEGQSLAPSPPFDEDSLGVRLGRGRRGGGDRLQAVQAEGEAGVRLAGCSKNWRAVQSEKSHMSFIKIFFSQIPPVPEFDNT